MATYMHHSAPVLLNYLEYILVWLLVILCIPSRYKKEIILTALISSMSFFWIALDFWYFFVPDRPGFQLRTSVPLIPEYELNLSLGLDGLSLVFLLLTTFIMPLCILMSDSLKMDVKQFVIYLFLLELFLVLSFITTNLFFFYVFFESILIPMFIIIGRWGSRERRIHAAYYFFFYTLFGSFFLLFGILWVCKFIGSAEYTVLLNVGVPKEIQKIFWLFFFIPFAFKIPMVPFHIWLPEAHVEAPTIGSIILASLLLKLGGYGFLRFTLPLFPEASVEFSSYVHLLAIAGVIYGSLASMIQNDMKRIIAYSSIAHMNLVVLGLFSWTQQGLEGAVFLMLAHGFVSSVLFFCVGVLYDRYHNRLITYYSGLFQVMPLLTVLFLLGSLGNMGFPGTANFVGELLTFVALFTQGTLVTAITAVSILASAIYSIWLLNRISFGTLKSASEVTWEYADLNRLEFCVLIILTSMMILFGLQPSFILPLLNYSIKYILFASNSKG